MGALGVTQLGNRIGRRKSLIVAAATATVGLIIQASSYSLGQLIVGRIIAGIGNGGVNATVPVWQSECTKPKSRGKHVTILGIAMASGIALGGWVNFGFSFINEDEVAWRFPLALPLLFTFILMAFTFSFPESPRWLISKGLNEAARDAMISLANKEHVNHEAIDIEINIISNIFREGSVSKRGFRDFFKREPRRLFYRLCLAVAVNFCAQMTGPNVISFYGTTIFKESLGLPAEKSALLNAGVLTFKIVSATVACLTVDRLGRKPLFIAAGLGMGCCMAGMAGTVWAIDNRYTYGSSVAATFFLFLYMVFLPLGFVANNFLYSAEIAPQDLRIYLAAVGTATHWLFAFVIAEITPIAFATISWRYYIVYAVIGVSVAPMVYFLFPETKGRSLEEMDRLFSEPSHWWKVPQFARTMESKLAYLENEENLKVAEEYLEQVE